MTATPVEDEILRELAQACAAEVTRVPVAGCDGGLRVLSAGPAAPDGQAIVLLHGRGHAGSVWFSHIGALAARQRVLAPDLPGFGASGAPPAPQRRARPEDAVRFFTDPIEALLEGERAAGRAQSFALVGHSLGGLVALELALRGRVTVHRLALIDSMGLGPFMTGQARWFFRLHPERLLKALGRRLFERLNPSPDTPLGRRVAALEHELLASRAPGRRAAARAFDLLCPLRGAVFNRRDALPGVTAPALIIWGGKDAALPVANAPPEGLSAGVRVVRTFPTLGHSPHLEAPAEVLAALLDFL
jgi:pimeloyl-ACP methyl ester carboxylesterase